MQSEKENSEKTAGISEEVPSKIHKTEPLFLIVDRTYNMLSWSESLEFVLKDFLYNAPHKGSSFLSCLPGDIHKKFQTEFRKAISGTAGNLEIESAGKDKILYLELLPQFDHSAEVQRIFIRFRFYPMRESEEINSQLRAVLNNASIGIFLTRPQGDIIDCNDVARKMFSYELQDFKRLGRKGLFASDGKMEAILKARAATGKVVGELTALRQDGKTFPVRVFSSLFEGTDGEIYTSTVLIDISSSKEQELKLEKYASRINEILESITDGFYSLNEKWEVTYWNKTAEKVFKVSRERILHKNLWNFFPLQKKGIFFDKYQRALKTGEKIFFEDYIEQSGEWVEINVYPGAGGLSVFFKIITDRKRIDEEIRMAKERYDLLSKVTREAIYDWDIEENALEWSEAYSTVFGYDSSLKESNIEDWKKKVHPDDLEEALKDLHASLDSPEIDRWQWEYRMFRTNGNIADVMERGHIIRNNEGKAVRMIGAIRDISQLKENERTLKQLNSDLKLRADELMLLNKELEEFAYIASHDLQEPLRMVTAFLSQLQKKYEGELDDKAQQYIHFAYDGAIRMRQIILDLLTYSRAGRNELKIEKIDLNKLMEHITGLCYEAIQEKKAEVNWKNLPVIYSSKTPLQQVFLNLLGNALKYSKTEEPPVINIAVEEKNSEWIFSISDNGIGIDSDFHEKIFVVFQRLHRREEFSGTGIGLAICKKIIERLGGSIWLESSEGAGSTFYFSLQKQF
ncbi:MAG: ATP-binding protein [Salegentibacter sp.]